MKKLLLLPFILIAPFTKAQSVIDWDGQYQLQLSDFQSSASEIGNGNFYSIRSSATFGFAFSMSNAEFMFTKNFNGKVNCTFTPSTAVLMAPDSAMALDLVAFARYEFDLTELYARKFRKKLYENKGAFSNVSFFKPIYDEIQNEFAERSTLAGKETDLGKNREKLNQLHQEVLDEIGQLADFCKTCKPSKKKK